MCIYVRTYMCIHINGDRERERERERERDRERERGRVREGERPKWLSMLFRGAFEVSDSIGT